MSRARSSKESAGGMRFSRRAATWRKARVKGRGAAVELLVDWREFMPAIEQAIEQAKKQILIETYMIYSDETGQRIIDRLCAKAKEGVEVWLVFDAIGSSSLTHADRQRLKDAGAHLRMFNQFRFLAPFRALFRTHRRLIVIDGKVGFVGGFGFADSWCKEVLGGPWHELVWRVRGRPLHHMSESIIRSWRYHHEKPQILEVPKEGTLVYSILNKTRWGSPHLRHVMVRRLRRARQRIWISTAYFVPPLYMIAALRQAARRGIDVRIMLPGGKSDYLSVFYAGRSYYHLLLSAGVKIYETRDRMLHAKALLIDSRIASVGSSNMDNWSLNYNREFNILVTDTQAAADIEHAMLDIQHQSEVITAAQWVKRSWWDRSMELCCGLMDRAM